MKVSLKVNGKPVTMDVSPKKRLLDILHDDLGFISVKEGCGQGECGACTVLLNGRSVNSCLVPAFQVDGSEVVTLEGLRQWSGYKDLERAYVEHGAVQCGFCLSGFVVSTVALLKNNSEPLSEEEIKQGLAGNLCRCTGYTKIVAAVKDLAVHDEIKLKFEEEWPYGEK